MVRQTNRAYIPLQDWSPDSPDYRNPGAVTIQNALPTKASPNYESQPSISLSSIGNINGATYVTNAVKYDGSTNFLDRGAGLTGAADSKSISFSAWVRIDAATLGFILDIENSSAGATGFYVEYNGSKFFVVGQNAATTVILNATTVATYSATSKWLNILFSANLATGAVNLYVNNVSDNNTVTATNDTISFTKNDCRIGADTTAGGNKLNGALAEVWCAPGQFIDFSVAGNRALFIDSNGFPVNLGSTGQTPTGSSPLIYMKSSASQVGVNSGTGGNFTANGTFAIASSSPSDSTPTQFFGGISAIDTSNSPHTYVGTSNKLAEITATTANNLSKSGGYAATTYWKFTTLNGTVFATDYTDNIQSMTIGGTVFADLAGSPPKAQCIAQWGQQIVVGNTNGGMYQGGTAGAVPNRVWGSQIGVPTSWPDPSTNTGQADQAFVQDLNTNYGSVQHLTNGVFLNIVFQQTGLTRAVYQGYPTVWAFDDYEKKIGLYCPNSVVQIEESRWAFISSGGFYMTDGYQVYPIGHNAVDATFLADLNTSYLSHVRGAFDPVTKLIKWIYPSITMTLQGGFVVCDKMIVYNYVDKRWGMGMVGQSIDMIFPTLTLPYTMEQLDSVNSNLDLITPSLDDPFWNGGVSTVGVFGIQQIGSTGTYASYSGNFSGAALQATFDTKEMNLNDQGRAMITAVKPVCEGTGTTHAVYIGKRVLLEDVISYDGPFTPNTRTGKANMRSDAVFHTLRDQPTGGFTNFQGYEIEWTETGQA